MKRKPTILAPVLAAALTVLLAAWAWPAVTSGDALWFLPVFDADASSIDLYWDGVLLHLEPGTDGFAELNEALQEELPHIRSCPRTVGISQDTLEGLRTSGRLLEIHYAEPARIHSQFLFGPTEVLYIPLSGHHSSLQRVFNAARGAPLQLSTMESIESAAEDAAQQQGLLTP